ncbi:MAG TPA: hypothetical protein VGQ00_04060 [Candidatus Norongarragalinales archaeon]|jgi:hypothetical protein|nr:hypothetical protein [Candidatus Norongarragalinales archaeon]
MDNQQPPHRRINWHTYIVALVITVLVFGVGILLGAEFARAGSSALASDLERLTTESTTLELLLALNVSEEKTCPLLVSQVARFDKETATFGEKLDFLERSNGRQDDTVVSLKRQYSLKEIRDYLLLLKINNACGHKFDTVLYFYSNKECSDCASQGEALTQLKQAAPDRVMIYSFDADIGGDAPDSLRQVYGISSYPALVVNGRVLQGYRSAQEVAGVIRES